MKVLDLPGEGVKDAADWVAGGGTREQLEELTTGLPIWDGERASQSSEAGTKLLPEIIVTGRHLRDISADAWEALRLFNDPPTLFQRGALPVDIIGDDDGRPILRTLSKAPFRGILDRVGDFMTEHDAGFTPARPPKDVVEDMLATKKLPLPVLRGIVASPVYTRQGVLSTGQGYQASTGFYLHFGQGPEPSRNSGSAQL